MEQGLHSDLLRFALRPGVRRGRGSKGGVGGVEGMGAVWGVGRGRSGVVFMILCFNKSLLVCYEVGGYAARVPRLTEVVDSRMYSLPPPLPLPFFHF